MENFDLVIVGAGSAGCIVTNQMINHSNLKVLLIEAGPNDSNPVIQVPLGYGMTFYQIILMKVIQGYMMAQVV